jgi:hypothetical protein
MKKIFLLLVAFTIVIQGLVSCKSEEIPPFSPEIFNKKFTPTLPQPVIDTIFKRNSLLPISILDRASINKNNLPNDGEHSGSDLVCTGLPIDNLTPGCPWVDDTLPWYPVNDPNPFAPKSIKNE